MDNLTSDEKFVLDRVVRSLARMEDDPNLPSGIIGYSKSGCRGVWSVRGTAHSEHIEASISLSKKLKAFLDRADDK